MLEALARNWWVLFLRGLTAILFGVLAFAWPGLTLWALVILFAVYTIADGLTALYLSLSGRVSGEDWWAMLLVGILGLVAGVIAIAWPRITATVLLFLIAAWAIARGIAEIAAAVRLRKVLDHEWMLGLAGALSILFGVALIAWPAAGLLAMVWLIGSFAVAIGITMVALSIRLRTFNRRIQVRH
jgi:uncharacterized membrane protein HdeD (DUF308 family)